MSESLLPRLQRRKLHLIKSNFLFLIYGYGSLVLIINLSFGAVAGIVTGIKEYKQRKKEKKLKKRIEILEKKDVQKDAEKSNEPMETPSENGYYKPENPARFYAE